MYEIGDVLSNVRPLNSFFRVLERSQKSNWIHFEMYSFCNRYEKHAVCVYIMKILRLIYLALFYARK